MDSKTEQWPASALNAQEIEAVFAEIAALSQSHSSSFEELARELLDRTVRLLAAEGGAVWRTDPNRSLRLVVQTNLAALGSDEEFHRRVLEEVIGSGEARVVLPGARQNGSISSSNPTPYLLLISPLRADDEVIGLMEVFQCTSNGAELRGSRRFLDFVCEIASEHLKCRELRDLRQSNARATRLEDFVSRVHGTLDVRTVAYELANEGRRLIGCDRVSVATRSGSGYRLIAISGVDTIDRRSNAVRRLEDLATAIGRTGQTFWYEGTQPELPPQIAEPLNLYLDQAHVRTIGVIPLAMTESGEIAGRSAVLALVIAEQFSGQFDSVMRDSAQYVADQGKLAVRNALQYESLPTLPFARGRDVLTRRSLFGVRSLAALLAAVVLAALCFIPADFAVYSQGQLQPRDRQQVFAPLDGQVIDLDVKHGSHVSKGDKLLELNSPQLDLESERVQGENETARKRLMVIESTMLQPKSRDDRDGKRASEFAAEREELVKLLESQQKQLQLLGAEREKLVVRSPIDGQVLTWEPEQLLKDRPVQRGQELLSVADLDSGWVAEIEVPDNRIGYVLDAQAAGQGSLAASFQLATDRRGAYEGTVRRISTRTDLNEENHPVVKVTMDFDPSAVAELRPGATIFARIHCGKKPLGYVWLHDVIETVRGWLFF